MFGAIALVAVYTFLTIRLKPSSLTFKSKRDSSLVWIGILGFVLLLVQVYLGTSVRETVDAIGKAELISTPSWIDELGVSFKIHRTFSLLVLAIVGWFGIRVLRTQSISAWPRVLLVIIVLETLVGVGLAYLKHASHFTAASLTDGHIRIGYDSINSLHLLQANDQIISGAYFHSKVSIKCSRSLFTKLKDGCKESGLGLALKYKAPLKK